MMTTAYLSACYLFYDTSLSVSERAQSVQYASFSIYAPVFVFTRRVNAYSFILYTADLSSITGKFLLLQISVFFCMFLSVSVWVCLYASLCLDLSILRHGGIWGAANEDVLNTVYRKKSKKSPCLSLIVVCFLLILLLYSIFLALYCLLVFIWIYVCLRLLVCLCLLVPAFVC